MGSRGAAVKERSRRTAERMLTVNRRRDEHLGNPSLLSVVPSQVACALVDGPQFMQGSPVRDLIHVLLISRAPVKVPEIVHTNPNKDGTQLRCYRYGSSSHRGIAELAFQRNNARNLEGRLFLTITAVTRPQISPAQVVPHEMTSKPTPRSAQR
jgi:hypothetical protein